MNRAALCFPDLALAGANTPEQTDSVGLQNQTLEASTFTFSHQAMLLSKATYK